MGFRKLNIAVNCESQKEVEQAQAILDELSAILRLNASALIEKAPLIRKNQSVIYQMFHKVANGEGSIIKNAMAAASLAAQIKT